MMMHFIYQDHEYPVEIIFKKNKNTYIRVKNGTVEVCTSRFVSRQRIFSLLEDKKEVIGRMIERDYQQQRNQNLFFLLGVHYEISLTEEFKGVKVDEAQQVIYCSSMSSLEKWQANFMQTLFLRKLEYWAAQFEEDLPSFRMRIRKMKTRWGVCNVSRHVITLNSLLLRYEEDCLDYVIVHELCHFLEANHSKKFWVYVSKYYPNYREIRKKLRS